MDAVTGSSEHVTYAQILESKIKFRELGTNTQGANPDHFPILLELLKLRGSMPVVALSAIVSDENVLKEYETQLKINEELHKKIYG